MTLTPKRILMIVLGLLLLAGIGLYAVRALTPQAALAAAPDAARAAVADRFMQALEAADYTAAHAFFDERVAAGLPPDKLREVWEALPGQLGPLASRGPARSETVGGMPVTSYRLEFEKMALDARVAVDDAGRVSGFRIVPASASEPPVQAPANADAAWRESTVTVAGALPGLLTRPRGDGPFPAVVLVHGSGPNDRDETIGPNKPFRDLAHGLAERGIASLRYDKRTLIQPEAFGAEYTVEQEVIADALAAVQQLREQQQIDASRIVLIGHSLGAMLAPRIAARTDALAGAVMLAGPARALHEVIPHQIRYIAGLDGAISDEEAAQIAQIEAQSAAVATLTDAEAGTTGLYGMSNRYLIDLRDYDALATARSLSIPLLILQGGRDYQVTEAEDFALWSAALGGSDRVTLTLYPDLNHLFMSGTGMATPQEYLFEGKRVDPVVIDDIARWMGALK